MTAHQLKISRQYLAYKLLTNLWFLGAVWLYFYRIYITDRQVGLLDSMSFAIGLIAEVPSGALADRFGRDKLVKLGYIMFGTGLLIQVVLTSFPFFVFGQSVIMIGTSFVSGADDALFYRNLNFNESSREWRRLVTRGSQIALVGTLFASVIGGYLHTINPRIPWILTAASLISSSLIIWSIKDDRAKKTKQSFTSEIKNYLDDIYIGFSQFRLKKLRIYVPYMIAVQGVIYAADFGLLRIVLLDRFHFSAFEGGVVFALVSFLTVVILAVMAKYTDNISEKLILTLTGIATGISLLIAVPDIGMYMGFVVILILAAGEDILRPVISEVLNKQAPEDQRATVLSVASFFRTLPYILLAATIGYLNERDNLEYFLIIWSIFIFIAVVLYLIGRKRDLKVDIE